MELDESIAVFGSMELFEDFDDEQLRLLAFVSETRDLEPGDVIYAAGDAPNGAYLLVSGSLEARHDERHDSRPSAIYRISPPALVGEMGLVLTRPRATTIVVRTRARVLFVPREPFMKLLRSDPDLAASVADKIRAELARYLGAIEQLKSRFTH